MTEAIPIELIRTDGGTQIRASTYLEKIDEYALAMGDGRVFPPLTVFFDGEHYWLADGFHRLGAYRIVLKALEVASIGVECEVVTGELRDAILYACGANDEHGIQRTDDDKRNAVDTVLKNPLVSCRDDGTPRAVLEIARICNVSDKLVAKRKAKIVVSSARNSVSYESGGKTVTRVKGSRKAKGKKSKAKAGETSGQPKGEVVQYVSKWMFIHGAIRDIDAAMKSLPAPNEAAANYPVEVAYTLPLSRVLEIKRWFEDFARFWEARDPEVQRFRQQQNDFIKEAMSERAR